MANDVASFNVFNCQLYILFSETSIHIFCPFSNWIICFSTIEGREFFIYSSAKSFVRYMVCRYFLPVLASLSFFLKRSKVLNFDEVQFIDYFSFMNYTFSVVCKNSSLSPMSHRLFPMISSKSFIILCFTFKPIIH